MSDITLYTVEQVPGVELIGAVSGWAIDADLATAEAAALDALRRAAADAGGNVVVGLRIGVGQELYIGSESGALSRRTQIRGDYAYRVHALGTAARTAR